jgi:multidrug efflux pump
MSHKIKEFFASSWAINNKKTIYILTIILGFWGMSSYNSLPKEAFPEIVVPTIYVSTVYPGTSPANMENLVTKQIEKQIKSISGVKKITSNSLQDFSNVIVEFNTDIEVADAKLKVSDAVDKASNDLPKDLPRDPSIMEINFSEFPIMNINLAGPYDLKQLNYYAELLQDRVEALKEITRVDLIGSPEREIQINVDMIKMQAATVTLGDIERAIAFENMTISGGTVDMNGSKTIVTVKKEFTDMEEIENLTINSMSGVSVPLSKIATVDDTTKEQESYARMDGQSVITLNVVKRGGENLIEASDKIQALVKEMQKKDFPKDLDIVITGDQSDKTRVTLHDLINTIIIGFILVTLVLMFFMGVNNALFVALSVPLSMCIAFIMMPGLDFTLNMIVLFAFLLALGIVVDDAIVVIENTHRIFDNGKVPIEKAAKIAAGEVFLPVLSGTLTTLAPFIPLAFWPGLIGKFMFYLPITLIVTLMASLLVAYIINPVFAVDFMKPHHDGPKKRWKKGMTTNSILFLVGAVLFYAGGNFGVGNFIVFIYLFYLLNNLVLVNVIEKFQKKTWPGIQRGYVRFLEFFLRNPWRTVLATIVIFIFSIGLLFTGRSKVVFFPKGEPNFVYTYIKLPVGTSPIYTDSITGIVENEITKVVGKNNPIVSSIISNVTVGVTDPAEGPGPAAPNKAKVSVAFVKASERDGKSTSDYLDKIRKAVKNLVPGAEITVDQEQAGPPTQKPINIEISGDNIDSLIKVADSVRNYLRRKNIPGVEELKSDFESGKPELVYDIDRMRAQQEGVSAAQIGMELRNAVFGKEVSKYRDANDEYPIMVRYRFDQRNSVEQLSNSRITFRDMNMGGRIRSIPISSFTKKIDTTSFGAIKRKNLKRVITIYSNVLGDFNSNEVVADVQAQIDEFENKNKTQGVSIKMTGEQEEQAETGAFLGGALLTSLALIFLILVSQFNSLGKPIIILIEILFSIIGVFLGVVSFGMDMSIIMTGIGVIALAGIVVRNGILLVEFTEVLKERGYSTYDAIVEAGRTRMTPVILTATAAILGLFPLAVGLNIDFGTLFTEFNPHIWLGGDSVAFWGPLSWTMIFGLSFATFLTLILIPIMYLLLARTKKRGEVLFEFLGWHPILLYIPFTVLIAKLVAWLFYRHTRPKLKDVQL